MKQVIITRKQFERMREVFDMYDQVDQIVWKEDNSNGIGPVVTLEFDPKSMVKVDITDVSNW